MTFGREQQIVASESRRTYEKRAKLKIAQNYLKATTSDGESEVAWRVAWQELS